MKKEEELAHVIASCYSGDDFMAICDSDSALARHLFDWCDWQSPESALPEVVAACGGGDGVVAFYG